MKFLSYLQTFGFTRNEIKVILLLSTTLLFGFALRYINSPTTSTRNPEQFDYSIPDSIFLERSKKTMGNPTQSVPDSTESNASSPQTSPLREPIININTATKNELMKLPGIGEVYAERIIIYRDDHGPFKSVDELENIQGIGKKKLERIKPVAVIR